jgi:hypothetical protein
MRDIAIAVIALTCASSALAEEWTGFAPVDSSSMPEYQNYRADHPTGYRNAVGDFDGDGAQDTAGFYVRGNELFLALRLAATPDTPVIIWRGAQSAARYVGVEAVPPGNYDTACKRYWRCEQNERSEVRLTHDGLMFWTFEGPAGFLHFRTETGSFEHELIWE